MIRRLLDVLYDRIHRRKRKIEIRSDNEKIMIKIAFPVSKQRSTKPEREQLASRGNNLRTLYRKKGLIFRNAKLKFSLKIDRRGMNSIDS